MRCVNCGNEIQDGEKFCPKCGVNIIPNTPSYNNSSLDGVVNNQGSASLETNNIQSALLSSNQSENLESSRMEYSSNGVAENNGGDLVRENSQANVQVATNIPDVSSVNGEKIGSSAPVITKKKVNKGLILAIVLVLFAIIGVGAFGYFYEFKSADKRLEIISKNLFDFTTKIKNDKVELSSGTYEINGKVTSGDDVASVALNGKYAFDLKNEIIDFTINATSLNMGGELLPYPLNLELYFNDSKAYFLLQNFYDKYIYVNVPETEEIFDTVSENDINYTILANGFKAALNNTLKALEKEQTVKDVTINDKTQKANVITIVDTANNERIMTTTFFRTLANNQAFVAELAKASESSEEEIKKSLLATFEDQKFEGNPKSKIEIYSPLFGNELLGIKIIANDKESNDNYIIEAYPIGGGYRFEGKENDKNVLKADFKSNVKTNSKETITNTNINLTVFENDTIYKIDLDFTLTEDVNPKVEKVNVKNSIDIQYLTEADIETITNNVLSYGNLGMYIQGFIGSFMPSNQCASAFNCQISEDGTSKVCYTCDDGTDSCILPDVVACPLIN